MKRIMVLIILIIICLGLYITNPTRDNFKVFVEENFRRELADDNGLTRFVSGTIASMTGKLASTISTREDYYLFSIYSLKIRDEEMKFIGVFNRFLPIQGF